ncbi:MAG: 2-dehydropantoate 2-reductase [Pseudomonadales bacterium]|nr:2-dehydropantoate 2-reductase [Pseudomonadales bacterium]
MRIAIYGVGGVGGYFGGRLAEAGEDVVFIARGEHLAAMRRDGLRIVSPAGDLVLDPVAVSDNPADAGVVDAVIVGVKAWQLREAGVAIRPMIGPETVVVPLQNGIDAADVLAQALGDGCVLGGTCGISAAIERPGCIRHAAVAPYIQFAPMQAGAPVPVNAEALRAAFDRARAVTAEIPADIQAALWQKFLGVAPAGAIGAITRAPMGLLYQDLRCRALVDQIKDEIHAVGQTLGVHWAPDAIERVSAVHATVPFSTTASMQRDIMDGRPSELDAQIGALIRLGEKLGVPTPVSRFVYDCLMPQEQRARGQIEF